MPDDVSSHAPTGTLVASPPPEYMDTPRAAAYLGFSPVTLEIWRCRGGGPPFTKLRNGAVRYRRASLDAFMAENEFRNNTEAREARRGTR